MYTHSLLLVIKRIYLCRPNQRDDDKFFVKNREINNPDAYKLKNSEETNLIMNLKNNSSVFILIYTNIQNNIFRTYLLFITFMELFSFVSCLISIPSNV